MIAIAIFKKRSVVFSVFCLLLFIAAKGQLTLPPVYIISADTAVYRLLPDTNWQVMADPGEKMQLAEVTASSLFQRNDKKVSYKSRVYWQRFRVAGNMAKEIEIALPEHSFRADLFTKIHDGEWRHYITGRGVPWSRRDGLKRIPAFTLHIPPGDTVTLYKRIYWNYADVQPDSMQVVFSFAENLVRHNYVDNESHYLTAIQDAFLLGMFILSIIINVYFFIIVREKEFLYFSLFLVSFCILALCSLNDAFLKENPQLLLYLYIIFNSCSSFFLIQFVRYFLKTFQHFPLWDKYLLSFSVLQVLVLLFSGVSSALFQVNLSNIAHFSENTIKLINGISLLLILLLYVRNKDRMVRLLLVALIPILFLQATAYALAVINGLYYARLGAQDIAGYESGFNSIAFFILILCYLWMMIIFTWVLFLRFSNLRKKLALQSSLDHLKSRFFANISHEFRTPLTLIIGPIEDMLQDKNTQKFREPLQYIHRNSKRLLQLINQLLDLSKLDVRSYPVNTNREDIIPFVKQIVHSFSSMAHHKNILLETEVDPRLKNALRDKTLAFYFDEYIFEKILYNLLSNAFKFTGEGGSIIVSISLAGKNLLELKIEDSGTGIPAEALPFIFDRFYQAGSSNKKIYEGTGIGLALVKELVALHNGSITVVSDVNKGTTFSCYFAFNKKMIAAGAPGNTSSNQNSVWPDAKRDDTNHEKVTDNSRPAILVVEDQQDVRSYICGKLMENYTVIEAKNGQEGFETAKEHMPNLVISDVMMPVADGFELCTLLKNDIITSHIPVILLTARAEDTDKITGLETGADAYLIKPFNSKELLIRVRNLIELRNKLRKKFSGRLVVKPAEITVTSQDSRFMQGLLSTVEKHIGDEKFSVEQLGREFAMSPSQINRKLKAIINQSAGAFIRSVRMQRAMELLKNDQATIAEIAYETGFSEPAYFSRVFKSYFGFPPSSVTTEKDPPPKG
ncbi:ATP-binding protein [Agriterribacter sp.]|uniref:ATP-binding protein n=1 Tax=Agriterribacter sp. TaxID=2821509 RepID=UPI002B6EEF26|nr:ATP-binding protein [Agriterribacter sp.]HRP55805.1 ATP-binding protein [Agriterribacter sp.]